MHPRRGIVAVSLVVVLGTTMTIGSFGAPAPAALTRYAIRGARIVTMAGPPIDKGTVLMRDGLIEEIGPSVALPADAVVIDGAGLIVYPGFIDMANTAAVETPEPAAPAGARTGGAGATPTLAEAERTRRGLLLRPDFEAARYARVDGAVMRRIASAGITSVLAVPASGLVRGQSALVNVMAPAESPQISSLADYRRGLVVVKSPVAQHVGFSSGGGRGGAYPGALLGTIAFVRQAFHDARWQRDARAYYEKHSDQPRPVMEPVLDALAPVLDGRLPAAFDANLAVEIARALGLAKEFSLDPIIVGGAEAGDVADDIKAARGRVIYSLNFPTVPERGRGGRAGGRGGAPTDEPIRTIRARQNAPKGPAGLSTAGVPFAFTSGGLQDLSLFLRHAARTVREGGLAAELALAALTSEAARIAGVEHRLGTLQRNRIANLVVTDGDWMDERTRIRHVVIDGRPIEIESAPSAPAAGGGGRRGGRGGPQTSGGLPPPAGDDQHRGATAGYAEHD
jgi:imidazolonepropionase-like amidohydrolase